MHVRFKTLLLLVSPVVLMVAAAYIQWGTVGLPPLSSPAVIPRAVTGAIAFPSWLRITHYVNFLFLTLLIRSGLQVLMEHPRLYWNVHCTPGTEFLRLTPVEVPTNRMWTSNDDARHLSPWVGLPGFRHTVGMARHWHFLSVVFWVGNGVVFVALLFATGQWQRLVPTSWRIVPEAWAVFVHYATFHLPPASSGVSGYNALQQLAYFAVVFLLAPLAIITGPSMSPALTGRFTWYSKLPGNRQAGRSIHFLVMCAFVVFLVGHVTLVAVTGVARNMNHIVLGSDGSNPLGLYAGLIGIAVVVLLNGFAHYVAWRHPRTVQHASKAIVSPVMRLLLDRTATRAEFGREDVSPFFWCNGSVPTSPEWTALAAGGFKDYRLRVYGLVQVPADLSLADIAARTKQTQITLHHCIQGWSGIAAWGGLPVAELVRLVRPVPAARAIVFHSFGEGAEGGLFYDSLPLENAMHPQCLLAYEMNDQRLNHPHGAPLRLRVENQLGFKMVKWIRAIEFVASVHSVGKGEGGYKEDHEYFGELANI